jgi:hypothetical protein
MVSTIALVVPGDRATRPEEQALTSEPFFPVMDDPSSVLPPTSGWLLFIFFGLG